MKTAHASPQNHGTIASEAISSCSYSAISHYRPSHLRSDKRGIKVLQVDLIFDKHRGTVGNSKDRCFWDGYTFTWKPKLFIYVWEKWYSKNVSSSKCCGIFWVAGGSCIFNLSALPAHKLLEQQVPHQILLQLAIFPKVHSAWKNCNLCLHFQKTQVTEPWKWKVTETDLVISLALAKKRALCSSAWSGFTWLV